jgi:hypothetical protein
VSVFDNAYGTNPKTAKLADLLEDIRTGAHASKVAALRELRPRDPLAYADEKKKLLAFCVSGTGRTRKEPLEHSGFLQIDLDDLGDRLPEIREAMKNDPHVAFGYVSPGGAGLKLGIRIDGQRHAESVEAAKRHFKDRYGLGIDPACSDRLRLCFVSNDPELWTNPDAVVLLVEPSLDWDARAKRSADESTSLSSLGSLSPPVSSVLHHAQTGPLTSAEEAAIRTALPTESGTNHRKLFDLARAIRAIEKKNGSRMSPTRVRSLVHRWHEQAIPFLKTGQSKDDYRFEFEDALERVRYPLGESVLDDAWKAALEEPFPPEADKFDSLETKRLVAFCYHLQRLGGQSFFYLSSREVQRRSSLASPVTAWRRLKGLCRSGVLEFRKPGNFKGREANEFSYVTMEPSSPPSEEQGPSRGIVV